MLMTVLSVSLLVKGRWLVKFGGSQNYTWIFDWAGFGISNPRDGPEWTVFYSFCYYHIFYHKIISQHKNTKKNPQKFLDDLYVKSNMQMHNSGMSWKLKLLSNMKPIFTLEMIHTMSVSYIFKSEFLKNTKMALVYCKE